MMCWNILGLGKGRAYRALTAHCGQTELSVAFLPAAARATGVEVAIEAMTDDPRAALLA